MPVTTDDLEVSVEATTVQARREVAPERYREELAPEPDQGVLAPGTRPMMVNVGIGPAFGLVGCSDNGCSSPTTSRR